LKRRAIELSKVKGDNARRRGRTVRLTKDAAALLDSLRKPGQKSTDRTFRGSGSGQPLLVCTMPKGSWYPGLCLALKPAHIFSWLAMAGA